MEWFLILYLWLGLWGQHASPNHTSGAPASNAESDKTKQVIPPAPPVVNPPLTRPSRDQKADSKSTEASQTLWFLRPEWMIVWVTIAYVVTAYLTLLAIKQQASIMAQEAKDAKEAAAEAAATTALTLAAIKRQADSMEAQLLAMKSKERARLSVEIGDVEFTPFPAVKYILSCHGTTPATIVDSWESVTVAPVFDPPWNDQTFGVKLRNVAAVIPSGEFPKEQFIYCPNH